MAHNLDLSRRVALVTDALGGRLLILASQESHFVNGAVILADDGFSN